MWNKMNALIALAVFFVCGCSLIAGREDVTSLIKQAPLKFTFIETLRNQASLRGEGFKEVASNQDSAGTLQSPISVFADAFRVYVVDSAPSGRIFIFDRGERTATILDRNAFSSANPAATNLTSPDGKNFTPIAADGTAITPLEPHGIVVDLNGIIYVSDALQGKVFGYDRKGRLLMTIGRGGGLLQPLGLAIDTRRNRIYIADAHAHQVRVFSTTGDFLGNSLFDINSTAKASEGFKSPSAVAIDSADCLYVLDGIRRRVYVYGSDAKFIRTFSVFDDAWGGAVRPKGIAVDSRGDIYVTDTVSNSIYIFGPDGSLLLTWGATGSPAGDFMAPAGISIDAHDSIYIADQLNSRIQHFLLTFERSE